MEHQLWQSILAVLANVHKSRKSTRCDYSDEDIVRVFYWAAIHDRPVDWSCERRNWPIHCRRNKLPDPSTMSRRLRSPSVLDVLNAVEQRVVRPRQPGLCWFIDGKPLPIGGCSSDRQAGFGRAAGCMAKGYKIHVLADPQGAIADWRLAPMNKDERVMAERMLATAPIQGYVVADSNYDSNKLHQVCQRRDLQLIARRRYGAKKGTGHRRQSAGRLRSIQLTENPFPEFAKQMLHDRDKIERLFGQCTNWGGGLTGLPAWVRTHRRVHRWVQAKLVLCALKRLHGSRTYAA
jgi:hypothetical protein